MPQPGFVRGAAIGAAGGFVLGAIFAGLSLSGQHKDISPQNEVATLSNSESPTPVSNETSATENSPPDHLYIEERRGTYGYAAAASPDDLAAGNASANVTFYRFLGVVGDTYKLEQVVGVPPSFVFLSCHKPCRVIDADMYSGSSEDHQTVVFDPRTIAGEAFTDAFNGRLKAYDANGRPLESPPEQSGDGSPSTTSNAMTANDRQVTMAREAGNISEAQSVKEQVGRVFSLEKSYFSKDPTLPKSLFNYNQCFIPLARSGNFSSLDGGKSSLRLIQACQSEAAAVVSDCDALSGAPTDAASSAMCNTFPALLAQAALKLLNK